MHFADLFIPRGELEAAAHKQGFASLDEVQRAVLEPGGVLALFGRKPDVDTMRMDELVARLTRFSGSSRI
jgi:hypothetical protein